MAQNQNNPLAPGTLVFNRYSILSIVGRGGLGTVYSVRDSQGDPNRTFALKETFDLSEGAREQFEKEARWLQRLDHRNIPKVLNYFLWNDRLYLIMEFVSGENLEQKLVKGSHRALPESDVLRWIAPICSALAYLHSQTPQIIHRDVKPANIIVTPGGWPALVDLGIAKEHSPGRLQPTATFISKAGTEGYAPPEQYASNGTTGPWSDIYSMGATLYHLLTGHVPTSAIDRAALDKQLIAPTTLNGSLSPITESIILRALAIRPTDRFSSMLEMKNAIEVNLRQLPVTSSPSLRPEPHVYGPVSAPNIYGPVSAPNVYGPVSAPNVYGPVSAPYVPSVTPYSNAIPVEVQVPTPIPASNNRFRRSGKAIERHLGANKVVVTPETQSRAKSKPSDSEGRSNIGSRSNPGVTPLPVTTRRTSGSTSTRRFIWQAVAIVSIVALIGVGVLVGLKVIVFNGSPDQSSPQNATSGYFAALENKDYSRAYQYFSTKETATLSQSQFTQLAQQDENQFGLITKHSIGTVATASDASQINVMVTRGNSQLNYTVILTATNGIWYLDSLPTK